MANSLPWISLLFDPPLHIHLSLVSLNIITISTVLHVSLISLLNTVFTCRHTVVILSPGFMPWCHFNRISHSTWPQAERNVKRMGTGQMDHNNWQLIENAVPEWKADSALLFMNTRDMTPYCFVILPAFRRSLLPMRCRLWGSGVMCQGPRRGEKTGMKQRRKRKKETQDVVSVKQFTRRHIADDCNLHEESCANLG